MSAILSLLLVAFGILVPINLFMWWMRRRYGGMMHPMRYYDGMSNIWDEDYTADPGEDRKNKPRDA